LYSHRGGFETDPKILLALAALALLPLAALAAPGESFGMVTNVVDGDTFDIAIEKPDPRIHSSVERVRLADVNSPEMSTKEGIPARDFSWAVLLNKRVYLDIDNRARTGRDSYGRLVCVVYLTGFDGQPVTSPCFNRMIVDSGYAVVENFTNNEFDPKEWWAKPRSIPKEGYEPDAIASELERFVRDMLRQLQGRLAPELERVSREAAEWLSNRFQGR
jgi:endonuclease YncB( thermonuclease family)